MRQVDRVAEEQPEPRTARPELARRRERQVDLQATWKQEHAVDRGSSRKVEQVDRVELGCELPGPVAQNLGHWHRVGHRERQVEIRPAISIAVREPSDHCSGDHPRIGCRHPQHAVAHPVAIVDAEHGLRPRRRR